MPYRITFKGDRQPEILNDEGGKEMYEDYRAGTLPERVEIKGRFVIPKTLINGIEYIVNQTASYSLSKTELNMFQRDKLARFLNEKGELTLDGELDFLENEQLITVTKLRVPVLTNSDAHVCVRANTVSHYQKMVSKISQWREWTGRRRYAQRMEAKELEKTASQI